MEIQPVKNKGLKYIAVFISVIIVVIIATVFIYFNAFNAPQKSAEQERFIVSLNAKDSAEITEQLKEKGFIKHQWAFSVALLGLRGGLTGAKCVDCISAGGYKISKAMSAWEIADILKQKPYMRWVVIPEGLRKEQIAEILTKDLGWSEQQRSDWISKYTAMKYDYIEGVYFPDTYLIPIDEKPLDVANRLRAKFEEKFASYSQEAIKQNIKWNTLLKIASIVQREAASKVDMPLIAGILWNRLLQGMKLEVDATVQYARDDQIHFKDDPCQDPNSTARKNGYCNNPDLLQPIGDYISEGDWWKPITLADKQIDSPYNTYLYKGLPPHPIANSGLDAINAVLNPTETECLYYLHDSSKIIHCAKTYKEHQTNIATYLKN